MRNMLSMPNDIMTFEIMSKVPHPYFRDIQLFERLARSKRTSTMSDD